ncbi:MAM and LDL-receptor class A domain-containing protein 1-like [Saccostrea cucullata]|uniref:MAM and LDL-receptor class A domain-containing protein 1-like n=1 Tax=Saccostrea cuccullata TaxID=36930 RepID=UPI002ED65154
MGEDRYESETAYPAAESSGDNCQSLYYDGEVPKSSDLYVFETITTFPYSMMAFCTNRCVDNLECLAVDICDSNGEKSCRLVRFLKLNLTTTDSSKTCRRYKVDKRCGYGRHYDEILKECKPLYVCDFETITEPSCFLEESQNDRFNWNRYSGRTGSTSTGPSGAKVGKYYKYIEASSPRVLGDNAKLVSNRVFKDETYCLSMYYNMYGQTTGTLKIQTRTGNDTAVTHWKKSDGQGTKWHSIELYLPLNDNTEIIIEAIRGSNFYSDIAVDYIVLWPIACP